MDLMDSLMVILTQDHFLAKEKSTPGSTAEVHVFTLHCSLVFHLVATIQQLGLTRFIDHRYVHSLNHLRIIVQ